VPKPEPGNPQGPGVVGSGLFLNGKAAMHMGHASVMTMSEAAKAEGKLNYGIASMPAGPSGLRGSMLGGGWVATKATKFPDQSYKLVEYLASPEGQFLFLVEPKTGIPTRKSQQKKLDPASLKFAAALSSGYTWINNVQGSMQLWTHKDKLFEQMWIGALSPDQVIEQLKSEGTNILKNAAQ
jgi:ABC-type glycerol-3-phosphate transport system substrate-binding protein